jgi:hypothetical protein
MHSRSMHSRGTMVAGAYGAQPTLKRMLDWPGPYGESYCSAAVSLITLSQYAAPRERVSQSSRSSSLEIDR